MISADHQTKLRKKLAVIIETRVQERYFLNTRNYEKWKK